MDSLYLDYLRREALRVLSNMTLDEVEYKNSSNLLRIWRLSCNVRVSVESRIV